MTNNFSLQVSYTYSDCIDISSGFWGQEGGESIQNPYNLFGDRGPCTFMIRHNVSANGLYLIPFKRNRLVSGWQLGGIAYLSTGSTFNIGTFSNGSTDIGTTANRVNYSAGASGCNSAPIVAKENRVTPAGVFYLNPACFTAPAPGEVGSLARDAFMGPGTATFNATLQKVTKLTERFTIQFRAEAFNVFNRKNFGNPGATLQQGANTSAASVASGSALPTFGQITTAGTMRQIQLGLKVIF